MVSQQQRAQTTTAVATILAATSAAVVTPALLASLATVGISAAAASAALTLTGAPSAVTVLPVAGPALIATAASENFYRAAYLVAAAGRIQASLDRGLTVKQAVALELPNTAAHLNAQRNRAQVAATVDQASKAHGYTLGWQAHMDTKTSAECRRANGKNFSVLSRPLIGWPGSVHPHCRCAPVAPFANAGWVDDVATRAERQEAVA